MVRILTLLLALSLAGCAGNQGPVTDIRGHLPDLHFRLVDDRGQSISEKTFQGQTTLVYFGYTGCGAECPVTLARLAALTRRASPTPRVLFVSVTPQIDRPIVLHAWLSRFDPAHMSGLTGDPAAAQRLARDLRAAWPQPGGGGHGNLVYVFDGQGHARFLITPQASDNDALSAIEAAGHG